MNNNTKKRENFFKLASDEKDNMEFEIKYEVPKKEVLEAMVAMCKIV